MFKKKDLTLSQLNFVKFQASTTDCKITYYYTYIFHQKLVLNFLPNNSEEYMPYSHSIENKREI